MIPKLLSHQITHTQRLEQAIQKGFGYLDSSPTGSGKTYVTCHLARKYGLSLVVIGPVSVLSYWEKVAALFGVAVVRVLSYHALRGSNDTLNHGLLTRNGKKYTVTDSFKQWLQKGVLLVFEEVHNLKNKNTLQQRAALTLVREVAKINNGSRIALLSATPFDKAEHCGSILMLLGLTLRSELYTYNRSSKIYMATGINDILKHCTRFNQDATQVLEATGYSPKGFPFVLYSEILKYHCSSSMPLPPIEAKLDVRNGFYAMEPEQVTQIAKAQAKLRRSLRIDEDGEITHTENIMAIITKFLIKVETAKIPTFIRLAKETLKDSKAKLIIYVWFKRSMAKLAEALSEFNPVIMNGQTLRKDRDIIIEKFQNPTSEIRLIISHAVVGGVGISLDDRDGEWPRYILASPNYHHILQHQLVGRIYRTDTKSDATVRFVYSRDCRTETSILNALVKKCGTVKNSLYKSDTRIKYPGEYAAYVEDTQEA